LGLGHALLAVLGLLLLGCRPEVPEAKKPPQAGEDEPSQPKLADGLYGVLREGSQEKHILPAASGETVVVNDHRYDPKESRPPRQFLAVHRLPDVPLVLASAPEVVQGDSGLMRIHLQLAREHAEAMERFTRKNKGGTTAVIINGEVVTVHKIRQVITGGRIQVTCCAEGSCDYLLKHLRDKAPKATGTRIPGSKGK
jgi:hypothetical protein